MRTCHARHSSLFGCLIAAAALLFVSVSITGCSSKPKPAEGDYSGQAKYAYEQGVEAYESSEYIEALKRLNYVRTKFPYSKFAALAALRIADTYFAQTSMPDAIEAYRRFIQLHPTHPDVAYAQFKIGMCYYEQLPGDWFFMPPAYEKDLASTEDAARALQRFLELHPNSSYADETREKLAVVQQRLADHEFFVATFYLKRQEPRAAAMRFERLLERFPGVGFDEEAMFLLGKCFLMLQDVPRAVRTWEELAQKFPDHPLTTTATDYINAHGLAGAAYPGGEASTSDTDVIADSKVE